MRIVSRERPVHSSALMSVFRTKRTYSICLLSRLLSHRARLNLPQNMSALCQKRPVSSANLSGSEGKGAVKRPHPTTC